MAVEFPPFIGHYLLDPASVWSEWDRGRAYYELFGTPALEVEVYPAGATIWDYNCDFGIDHFKTGSDLREAALKHYDFLIRSGRIQLMNDLLREEIASIKGVGFKVPELPLIRWSFYPGLVMYVVRLLSAIPPEAPEGIEKELTSWQVRYLGGYSSFHIQCDTHARSRSQGDIWVTEYLVPAAFLFSFCRSMVKRDTDPVIPEIRMVVDGWLTTTFDHVMHLRVTGQDGTAWHEIGVRAVTFGESAAMVN
jgi:hypothetical protein